MKNLNENRPPIREYAASIAEELGARLVPLDPDRDADQYVKLATAEGPELTLHYHWQTKRLVTGFNLPMIKDRDGHLRVQTTRDLEWYLKRDGHAVPDTSITTDPMKNACAVARDIRRRILPGAILYHTVALERKAESEKHTAGVAATVKLLATRLKCEARGEHLYPGGVDMQVSSPDSVRFTGFYVDAETALKIVKLVQESKATD